MTGLLGNGILDYTQNSNDMIDNQFNMEAILTRDQRTTSHRVINPRSELETRSSPSSFAVRIENIDKSAKVCGAIGVERTTSITASEDCSSRMRTSSNKRIRGYAGYRGLTVTWLRLGSLLVTLLVASIHAAPTMTTDRTQTQGRWVNPCGLLQGETEIPDIDVVQLSDDQLLAQIVLQTKTAYMDAQIFREDFIKKAFGRNFTQLHEDWKSQHYDWLPSRKDIPKNLDEPLDQQFLDKLDLDTALLNAYEYMQKYAVALEQVVWDQLDQKLELREKFVNTENKLRMVLCEIQVALVERQVKQRPDVTRDIMPSGYRNLAKEGDTDRNLRDWLIFRDYMNGLQYVDQVFGHLRKRINS